MSAPLNLDEMINQHVPLLIWNTDFSPFNTEIPQYCSKEVVLEVKQAWCVTQSCGLLSWRLTLFTQESIRLCYHLSCRLKRTKHSTRKQQGVRGTPTKHGCTLCFRAPQCQRRILMICQLISIQVLQRLPTIPVKKVFGTTNVFSWNEGWKRM